MFLLIILILSGLLPPLSALPASSRPAPSLKETRMMMGTVVSVEIAHPPPSAAETILEPFWKEASRLESLFSRYDPDSELNRVNRSPGRWVEVKPELLEVLSLAAEIAEASDGAFDVTVGPLMRLWGFYPRREGRVPDPDRIKTAAEKVDWRAVNLCGDRSAVMLSREGMELDLGGIAKGYVVDRLAGFLEKRGVTGALINAGGDIYCLGNRPSGGAWRIGVEDPRRPGRPLQVLELADLAVATSGAYQNYFIHDLRRYSHIIDPRSGRPAESLVEAVTVIASECVLADALATAVFVLGASEGVALAERFDGVEILVMMELDEEPAFLSSSGWPGAEWSE